MKCDQCGKPAKYRLEVKVQAYKLEGNVEKPEYYKVMNVICLCEDCYHLWKGGDAFEEDNRRNEDSKEIQEESENSK